MDAASNAPSPASGRQKRIRNWALLIALIVLAGMVYGISVVRMIQQHQLPHFF